MKKYGVFLIFFLILSIVMGAYIGISKAENNRVLVNYLADIFLIQKWNTKANNDLVRISKNGDAQSFFKETLAVETKTLALYQNLQIPNIPEIKDWHNQLIEVTKMMIKAFEFGRDGNIEEFNKLKPKVEELTRGIMEKEGKFQQEYHISDQVIKPLMDSQNLN
jgi:hypothetical protein